MDKTLWSLIEDYAQAKVDFIWAGSKPEEERGDIHLALLKARVRLRQKLAHERLLSEGRIVLQPTEDGAVFEVILTGPCGKSLRVFYSHSRVEAADWAANVAEFTGLRLEVQ